MDILSYYTEFVKPVIIAPVHPMPIIIKSIPLMWWWPIAHEDRGMGIQFCTEESYIVRPNETEMRARIVEILSEGVYDFLKGRGLLKEAQGGIEKTFGWKGRELDDYLHGLTKGKNLS